MIWFNIKIHKHTNRITGSFPFCSLCARNEEPSQKPPFMFVLHTLTSVITTKKMIKLTKSNNLYGWYITKNAKIKKMNHNLWRRKKNLEEGNDYYFYRFFCYSIFFILSDNYYLIFLYCFVFCLIYKWSILNRFRKKKKHDDLQGESKNLRYIPNLFLINNSLKYPQSFETSAY